MRQRKHRTAEGASPYWNDVAKNMHCYLRMEQRHRGTPVERTPLEPHTKTKHLPWRIQNRAEPIGAVASFCQKDGCSHKADCACPIILGLCRELLRLSRNINYNLLVAPLQILTVRR